MTTRIAAKRCAIYARRSDESGDDRSIPEQVETCRRWIAEHGYVAGPVYQELGSGVTGYDRKVFQQMIREAETRPRPFDAIVVLDLSRFGRADLDETGFWRHRLTLAGVDLHYVLDGDALEGPAGQLVGSVLQHAAHDFCKKTSYKVTLGHLGVLKEGYWPGGGVPYGYRLLKRPDWDGRSRKQTRLVIDETQAPIVRRIFELYAQGSGFRRIAIILNSEPGVPGPRGHAWDRTSVRKIVRNQVYTGDLVGGGRTSGSKPKFHRMTANGPVPVKGDPGEPAVFRDAVPAIIERSSWEIAQSRRQRKRAAPTGGVPGVLSGIAKCASCGSPLAMVGATISGQRYRYYRCRRARDQGAQGECARVRVCMEKLERFVLDSVRAAVADIDREKLRRLMGDAPLVNVATVEARRRRLAAKRDALLTSDDVAGEFFMAALAKLKEEDERLLRELESARLAEARRSDADGLVGAIFEAARNLDAPDTLEGRKARREAVGRFIAKLEVGARPKRGAPAPVALEVRIFQALGFTPTGHDHPSSSRSKPDGPHDRLEALSGFGESKSEHAFPRDAVDLAPPETRTRPADARALGALRERRPPGLAGSTQPALSHPTERSGRAAPAQAPCSRARESYDMGPTLLQRRESWP